MNFRLTDEQTAFYAENGYLLLEELFRSEEVDELKAAIAEFRDHTNSPNIIRESNGDVRSVFAPHYSNKLFEELYKDPRLVIPGEQLIGDDVYLYQYKINIKEAFDGDVWEWHQDFPYWHLDDQVSDPAMVSVMILLQDTRSYQGSLMIIPASHKEGLADFEPKNELESMTMDKDFRHSLSNNLKYTVARQLVRDMADEHGIKHIEGPAGTVLFFHPNIFHASPSNVSPYERDTAIITYNGVNNSAKPMGSQRPDYLCARDTAKIEAYLTQRY
ncbi:MAG: phytanoyl-CoA dioxygenase family protein [Cytophagales bacterium]|nr:phytanoyl-CoA dioxygenase family protein [Cytophagales bacterium]